MSTKTTTPYPFLWLLCKEATEQEEAASGKQENRRPSPSLH